MLAPTTPTLSTMSPRADDRRLELLVDAQHRELLRVTAQEEEALEVASVRLEEDRLEALDRAVRLQPAEVLHRRVERLDRFGLAAAYDLAPADEETGICHVPPPVGS